MLITWQDFKNTCKNLTVDFENMCRLFFKYHFVKNKMINIRQKANNPGIETEPVLIHGERIGFQAKYYSNNPSYSDILDSANKVVKNVDIDLIFSYAYYHIVNNLGYDNNLFSAYDRNIGYGRGRNNCYIERIGKKYEWIAMYHVLALMADNYEIDDRYFNEHIEYKGTWYPHIRDFDPTLNLINSNRTQDIDVVLRRHNYENWDLQDNNWAKKDDVCSFIDNVRMTDKNGDVWYALYFQSDDDTGKDYDKIRQYVWTSATACFIDKKEFKNFVKRAQDLRRRGDWIRAKEVREENGVFAREYVWAPAYYNQFGNSEFKKIEIETGVKIVIKIVPTIQYNGKSNDECNDIEKDFIDLQYSIIEEEREAQEPIKETIGSIMPCCHSYSWGEGYDYSKEDTVSIYMPCDLIVKSLDLKQTFDGIWQHNDEVVCVDFSLIKDSNVKGLYIKEEYYRKLVEGDLKIVWIGLGEKQHTFGKQDYHKQVWSDISALVYENGNGKLLERIFIEHNETDIE